MRGRKKIPMRKSKRDFTRTASKTHWKNVKPRPMRGGIRM